MPVNLRARGDDGKDADELTMREHAEALSCFVKLPQRASAAVSPSGIRGNELCSRRISRGLLFGCGCYRRFCEHGISLMGNMSE